MRYIVPEQEDPCDEVLKKYYFYLALENSICEFFILIRVKLLNNIDTDDVNVVFS